MADRHVASLLSLDPDLGQLLEGERLAAARRELRVVVHTLDAGPWDVDNLSGTSREHIGLLVLGGVLAREVLVLDTVSTELLGPGDVVRPWRLRDESTLLRHGIRWNVLARSCVALLDRRFGAELAAFPEVNAALIDRVNERALRLAITQAISQLNRVDRRLLALFWHLAERWGRMTKDGVVLPMTLSHRMLGQLIGARRPTVSTALSALARGGELQRRDDGTWLLTGAPVGDPVPEIDRVVPMRRHLLPADEPRFGEAAVVAAGEPTESSGARDGHVEAVLARLGRRSSARVEEMRTSVSLRVDLPAWSPGLRRRWRATTTRRGHPAEPRR